MPRRDDIHSILIIGAGPIVIGQACEFDYSGVQACKVLRNEGYRIILVNSNPATIMTDSEVADVTYIEPLIPSVIEKIIERERPDAILPTMGGQTALNCALLLSKSGCLDRYGTEMIGAKLDVIEKAENRQLFKACMDRIGLESARSGMAYNMEDALAIQADIGFPAVIRPSFTLGGSGGGIAYNAEEFVALSELGLSASPVHQLLIEESLLGWKEFEMEVVRDCRDNCIIVCAIENIDPMGIHTGDSMTITPAQTLTDTEYQRMRRASIDVLREIGVDTGGSNVQFAVNPHDGRMVVIEMNPRVSRSSALASKATGFPIAKVAALLAVGYTLDELSNDVTGGEIPSSFEPSLDYVVVKIPRFSFEKFPLASDRLTTQMKSVGEVMAIGSTFDESFQKALRSLERGVGGFEEKTRDPDVLVRELAETGPLRILYVADAFRAQLSLEEVFRMTRIDPWFLSRIAEMVRIESITKTMSLGDFGADDILFLKQRGFSDHRISTLIGCSEQDFRNLRHEKGIHPVFKQVDSCAAEFSSATSYLYSTYRGRVEYCPVDCVKKVIILGGGPNRIGQGLEFDYCCVCAAMALRAAGYSTLMLNCNPETVSTDCDVSDCLYFEPLTLEDILEVVRLENPVGVIVQFGGQTPLNLSRALEASGVPIWGTLPDMINCAEDRQRSGEMLSSLGLLQPENRIARNAEEAFSLAEEVGYPLVLRPSYVLGGRAMEIVHRSEDLRRYMNEAICVSGDSPILLDRFLSHATEVDVDAISDGHDVIIAGVVEHIEEAGIHSGDSSCVMPTNSLSFDLTLEIKRQTVLLARAFRIVGLVNVQFAVQNGDVYVLEVNPRASRTVPFVSRVTNCPLSKVAALCMSGVSLRDQGLTSDLGVPDGYWFVKEVVFPFSKFFGVDTILGPEMRSTGEVMGVGRKFSEAFAKSQLASGKKLPSSGVAFISVKDYDKPQAVRIAAALRDMGFSLVATSGTSDALMEANIPSKRVNKVKEGRPHVVDMIKNREIDFILNTVDERPSSIADSRSIRTTAVSRSVVIYTTIESAAAACKSLYVFDSIDVYSIQSVHRVN
ncbi:MULTISPECIES: carbamoyl-phosphate synthase large subunit [Candidatus Ichthyocystis]|uniref:Carbamoyl phosphate synthase large chain n=1 Tax=Candidatus Ichthyocystis hellenicum TaxID=1561003 RepID=A0A0S4M3T1_9BURK|nr:MULTISPECIES: carbamoyl-phosphate synthase large subunit [Ichthyocystis]CUT17628.1 carbamoyl phosphate synthase large subunit [Candidatus Ichthyocystis hellenicum]